MEEYRTRKVRMSMAKTTDSGSAEFEDVLDELLKCAPHLKPLRNAARSNEESRAGFQRDILEDFRRKLRGE